MAEPDRRGALRWVVRGLTAAVAAVYAIPAVRYLVGLRRGEVDEAIDVGPLAALPEGVPQRVAVHSRTADGWSPAQGAKAAVFLLRRGPHVRALDSTCPHTGCAVDWDQSQSQFRCPCHKSAFSVDGERLGGPAPRGLDPESVEVKDGRVLLRYRRYRTGRPDRVPT